MALYAAQNEKEDPIMGNDGQRAETEPLKSRVGISTRSLFMEEIGGAAYLSKLINAVPSALHVESYADTVID
ncbi:MAG: DnaB-like helicase N-terminal domain-containing protein, partial [Promethearchaeota archaeon]